MPISPAPLRSGRVTTEGDQLYYEVRGQGPPLLLIPGAGGDADRYTPVATLLADAFTVITYDRRANARSTSNAPQNFEIGQQSRDAVAVLRAAGAGRAFVLGNSSGAVIALDMAKTQPEAVRAVIAHEPPLARVHPETKRWQRFYAKVYLNAFRYGSSFAILQFLFGTQLPVWALINGSRQGRRQGDGGREPRVAPQATTDFLMKQELLPVTNYAPDLAAIQRAGVALFPAAGRASLDKKRWYAETAQILADQLGRELVVFPGHHGSFLDQPEAWAATLRATLQRAIEAGC